MAERSRQHPLLQLAKGLFSRFWGILAIILAWQLWVVAQDYNSIVMPTPTGVIADIVGNPEIYLEHTLATVGAAAPGLVLGMSIGVALAAVCWFSAILDGVLTPLVVLLRSIPVVAIIPLIARIAGYDFGTVLFITTMLAFFPAYVFGLSGLQAWPPACGDQLKALGCFSRRRLFWLIALPASVPNLLAALRLAAPICVLAALIAEFLMGTSGLGYLMMRARNDLIMERAWGAALVATAFSVALFMLATWLDNRLRARWEIH